MLNWNKLHTTSNYTQLENLPEESWKDVPGFAEKYQLSNYGRARSKDTVRIQKHRSSKMVEHLYKGKLISIDYSASKFGALNMYDKGRKQSVQIYDTVCQLFGQEHADKFFLDDTSYAETKNENWVSIPGWQDYEISTAGHIRRVVNNHYVVMKPWIGPEYYVIRLSNNNQAKDYLVHRLVAETFIPNPDNKPQVNHIDGDKLNNDVDNLEWVTESENMQHAYDTGLVRYDVSKKIKDLSHGRSKTYIKLYCKELNITFESIMEASRKLNLPYDKLVAASLNNEPINNYTFERRI